MRIPPLFLLCLLSLVACDKNEDTEVRLSQNTFISQKNALEWKGTTELNLMENDTLVFLGVGNGLDNGVLVIKVRYEGTGSHELKSGQGLYYDTLGGDVIVGQYGIGEVQQGKFWINSFDDRTGEVKGGFELNLETNGQSVENGGTELIITDGQFRGTIKDEISP